jgi:carboxypeptidase C (cathepsin A)
MLRFLSAAILLAATSAHAQTTPSAVKTARLQTAKGPLDYTATWSEIALKDITGQPQATISTTSYERSGVPSAKRPVVFVFAGGPGAASLTLNYGLFGPESRIVEGAPSFGEPVDTLPDGRVVPTRFAPNPDTLLDIADLVMVDTVGTGFSRELHPGGGQTFWSVQGDIDSSERAIRAWLSEHHRTGSPVYIAGESYGGFRTGFLAAALEDLDVRGLILLSPGIDLTDIMRGDLGYAAYLPVMAVAAVEHGVVPARGRTIKQVYDDAQAFVASDYVAALHQGSALPAADRDRMAQRLSALIGLPAELIAKANLRIESQAFLEQLVPGKVVGRLDGRAIDKAPDQPRDAGRDPAADDPALGLHGTNVRISRPVGDHLRAMGVKAPGDYVALTLDVNFRWDFRPLSPAWDANLALDAMPAYANFMAARPDAHIMIAAGYHDLAVPPAMAPYSFAHSTVSPDRVTFRYYDAGHTIFDDPAARKLLLIDIRHFITGP